MTYETHENTDEVSCREKIANKNLAPTNGNADKEEGSSNVIFWEHVENLDVSARKQLPTPSTVYRRIGSDDPNDLDEMTRSVGS